MNLAWTEGEVPGTQYGSSKKGWIDRKLFYHCLSHFLHYAVPARPLLLLLDGHSSHFQPEVLRGHLQTDFSTLNVIITLTFEPPSPLLTSHTLKQLYQHRTYGLN